MSDKTESREEQASPQQRVVSCDELEKICGLVVDLTRLRQNECKHLCIENFAPDLLARLLFELGNSKKGMVRAEWLMKNDS